jgi:hypothetical protein
LDGTVIVGRANSRGGDVVRARRDNNWGLDWLNYNRRNYDNRRLNYWLNCWLRLHDRHNY